ncbi:hypothetical protein M3Y98_00684300 [Aphelenchoides besseyi]|nr:hypothetical protein M3Y98_00684300 [Aphelenchoides besseyi]
MQNNDAEQGPSSSSPNDPILCRICGINFIARKLRDNHENTHKRTNGWKCSCCGCFATLSSDRNKHEKLMHNFSQLSSLFNVGLLLVEVQQTARHSTLSRNDPDATIEEIQLLMDSKPSRERRIKERRKSSYAGKNFGHIQQTSVVFCEPKADLTIKTLRRSKSVEIIILDHLNSESSAPQFQSSSPFRLTAPLASIGLQKADVNLLSIKLSIGPQFLYYDYKELPIQTWKDNSMCELLVLRFKQRKWNGDARLNEPVCHFMLSDVCDHFLVFAKPNSQLLVDTFVQMALKFPSFVQLMKHVKQMNLRSIMVIASEANKHSIAHLVSSNFVVF